MYKIGNIDCVHVEGLAWILSPLYSTRSVKGSDYAGHSNESFARERVYSRPVTRCKSRVRAKVDMASHKPNTISELSCCQLLVFNPCSSAQKVGQGEVGGVTRRVLCTWQLLGWAVKGTWLALGGPIFALAAQTGLENSTLTCRGLISGMEGCLSSERAIADRKC